MALPISRKLPTSPRDALSRSELVPDTRLPEPSRRTEILPTSTRDFQEGTWRPPSPAQVVPSRLERGHMHVPPARFRSSRLCIPTVSDRPACLKLVDLQPAKITLGINRMFGTLLASAMAAAPVSPRILGARLDPRRTPRAAPAGSAWSRPCRGSVRVGYARLFQGLTGDVQLSDCRIAGEVAMN